MKLGSVDALRVAALMGRLAAAGRPINTPRRGRPLAGAGHLHYAATAGGPCRSGCARSRWRVERRRAHSQRKTAAARPRPRSKRVRRGAWRPRSPLWRRRSLVSRSTSSAGRARSSSTRMSFDGLYPASTPRRSFGRCGSPLGRSYPCWSSAACQQDPARAPAGPYPPPYQGVRRAKVDTRRSAGLPFDAAGHRARGPGACAPTVQVPSPRPDARASARATAANCGAPVLVNSVRPRLPDYPIVIEAASSRDHVVALGQALGARLAEERVPNSLYLCGPM